MGRKYIPPEAFTFARRHKKYVNEFEQFVRDIKATGIAVSVKIVDEDVVRLILNTGPDGLRGVLFPMPPLSKCHFEFFNTQTVYTCTMGCVVPCRRKRATPASGTAGCSRTR